jgi:hypothetical protein
MELTKTCLGCSHMKDCPILLAWVKATENPMVVTEFYCQQFKAVTETEKNLEGK